jgi:hypothetical protein
MRTKKEIKVDRTKKFKEAKRLLGIGMNVATVQRVIQRKFGEGISPSKCKALMVDEDAEPDRRASSRSAKETKQISNLERLVGIFFKRNHIESILLSRYGVLEITRTKPRQRTP